MGQEMELAQLDVRYENYRMKNPALEKRLLASIAQRGIEQALEGTAAGERKILLNGFKRRRCALRLGLHHVPYVALGDDEAGAILNLLRVSNQSALSLLEQARFIRSEEHTSELQSRVDIVCRLLLEKKKRIIN